MRTHTMLSVAVIFAACPALAQEVQSVAGPEPITTPVPIVGTPAEPAAAAPASDKVPAAKPPPVKQKPKAGKAIGETVGGVLGGAAAATTGPIGGALGGFVGKKLGGGLGGALHKMFGGKTAKPTEEAAREAAPLPVTAEQPTAGPASFETPPTPEPLLIEAPPIESAPIEPASTQPAPSDNQ